MAKIHHKGRCEAAPREEKKPVMIGEEKLYKKQKQDRQDEQDAFWQYIGVQAWFLKGHCRNAH
jgi:hypothetical protein